MLEKIDILSYPLGIYLLNFYYSSASGFVKCALYDLKLNFFQIIVNEEHTVAGQRAIQFVMPLFSLSALLSVASCTEVDSLTLHLRSRLIYCYS